MIGTHSGWYAITLNRKCQQPGCHADARYEVFNRYNATYGKMCATHARNKIEQSDREALARKEKSKND